MSEYSSGNKFLKAIGLRCTLLKFSRMCDNCNYDGKKLIENYHFNLFSREFVLLGVILHFS